VEQISWKPRAWVYHNFLTDEEVDHIVKSALPTIARSSVVEPTTGKSLVDPIRTSYGTFLRCAHQSALAPFKTG
jgi:prolyl 4-hydroxylase